MSINLRPNHNNNEHLKTKYLRSLIDSNINNLLVNSDKYVSERKVSERKVSERKVSKRNMTVQDKYIYIDNFVNNYFKYINCINNTDNGYTTDDCTSDDDDYFDDYLSN